MHNVSLHMPTALARKLSEVDLGEEHEGYKVMANEFEGEWDWGVIYQLVVFKDYRFWGRSYRVGGAKTGYNSFDEEEGDTVEFYEMMAHDVVHTEYTRKVNPDAVA